MRVNLRIAVQPLLLAFLVCGCQSRASGVGAAGTSPTPEGGAPARVDPSPRTDAGQSQQAAGGGSFDGTFVNYLAREINVKIVIVGAQGSRPQEIAEYVHAHSPAADRTEIVDTPLAGSDAVADASSIVHRMFSFIPQGLGEIRGFRVRVHLAALSGPATPAQLDSALYGATSLILVAPDDPGVYTALVDRVTSSPVHGPSTRSVLLLEQPTPAGAPAKPVEVPGVAVVVPTAAGDQERFYAAVIPAVKLALDRLKEPHPASTEPLRAVPAIPFVDMLRLLEQQKGRPLTEAEVLEVRDHAPSIMLTVSTAQKLAERRGYPDLDPDHIWEQWQKLPRTR